MRSAWEDMEAEKDAAYAEMASGRVHDICSECHARTPGSTDEGAVGLCAEGDGDTTATTGESGRSPFARATNNDQTGGDRG